MNKCPIPECGKEFKSKRDLLIHLKKTVNECPVCGKKVTYDGLVKHLRMSKDDEHKKLLLLLSESNHKIKGEKELKVSSQC
ncbi:hypothetical protein HS5_16870 [Acidianus sp. HS-5]|nr:hypothetical protein HS5_16870 [Acidianus sp. HS-5]